MFFYTPRGLKIRLDENYCFNQSFKPGINIYDVLNETELFATLRDFWAFGFGIILFVAQEDPLTIFSYILYTTLIGIFIPLFYPVLKIYRNISLLFLDRIFAYLSYYYIDKIIIMAIGLFYTNWITVIFYFLGFYLALFIGFIINFYWARYIFKKTGIVIMDVERIFINLSRINLYQKKSFIEWINDYKDGLIKEECYI